MFLRGSTNQNAIAIGLRFHVPIGPKIAQVFRKAAGRRDDTPTRITGRHRLRSQCPNSIGNVNADRRSTNMAEFLATGGCPCTDKKQFSALNPYARSCEFDLQLGMLNDRCSFIII